MEGIARAATKYCAKLAIFPGSRLFAYPGFRVEAVRAAPPENWRLALWPNMPASMRFSCCRAPCSIRGAALMAQAPRRLVHGPTKMAH
jgi:hypothetical protein